MMPRVSETEADSKHWLRKPDAPKHPRNPVVGMLLVTDYTSSAASLCFFGKLETINHKFADFLLGLRIPKGSILSAWDHHDI